MNCLVCDQKANDEDVVELALEAAGNRTVRVCELCACDVTMALFNQRTVTVQMDEGAVSIQVL